MATSSRRRCLNEPNVSAISVANTLYSITEKQSVIL